MLVRDRESMSVDHKRPSFLIEWIGGIVGGITTMIGLWMYHGPADGILRLFGWEWNVADLSEGWALSVVIIGAVVMASVLARLSQRLALRGSPTAADATAGGSLLSLLLALVYAIVWIF